MKYFMAINLLSTFIAIILLSASLKQIVVNNGNNYIFNQELQNYIGGCGGHPNTRCYTQTPGCPGLLCWGAGEYKACGGIHPGFTCTQNENILTVCTCLKGAHISYTYPITFSGGFDFDYLKGPDCF